MRIWCLTTSPDNFAATAGRGWKVQGVKSGRHRTAKELRPGDKLVYYITRHVAFGGIVEVTSTFFEDHDPIWTSKPGEDYPWRVDIARELVLTDPQAWVPVEALREALEYPRKWPAEHWRLAFQGNVREWPVADYEVVRGALEEAGAS
jgi:hypothetical protein